MESAFYRKVEGEFFSQLIAEVRMEPRFAVGLLSLSAGASERVCSNENNRKVCISRMFYYFFLSFLPDEIRGKKDTVSFTSHRDFFPVSLLMTDVAGGYFD